MRVHELAKELGVSSKELLGALKEMGADGLTASSSVPDQAVPRLPGAICCVHVDRERAPIARGSVSVGEVVDQLLDPDSILGRPFATVQEPTDDRVRGCVHIDRESRSRILSDENEWVFGEVVVRLRAERCRWSP